MKQIKDNITLRVTKQNVPVFNQIIKIAEEKNEQFTSTMLNFLKLGLKFYQDGYRIVDDELVKLPSKKRSLYSIDNEVAESLYSSLAGLLADMDRCENEQQHPDKVKLEYYKLIRNALWEEKRQFNTFSDEEISENTDVLAPILKNMVMADNYEARLRILEQNRTYFNTLIKKAMI